MFEISGILLFLREIDHYSISSEKSTKMAAASTTAMNTNKSENNAEEDSDEVIYDLTTDFRAASRALGEIYLILRYQFSKFSFSGFGLDFIY